MPYNGFKCTFEDCSSTTSSRGISLHQFPKSDPELQHWINFVKVKKFPEWQPRPSSRLCSLHFRASEYNGKRLKNSAIPTVTIDMEVSDDDEEEDLVVTKGKNSYSKMNVVKDDVQVQNDG